VSVEHLHVESFPVGPLACNCAVVADTASKEAVIVDPGGDPERILHEVRQRGFTVKALVHTHAHIDHVAATGPVREAVQAPACLHLGDRWLYDNVALQASFIGLPAIPAPPLDAELEDRGEVAVGRFHLRVLHTPGHSPGSVCFTLHAPGEGRPEHLFSGDTLFRMSIGRTDLWGGSFPEIMTSIKERLLPLPDDTPVICGHGPATTVGRERAHNPFLGSEGGETPPGLF